MEGNNEMDGTRVAKLLAILVVDAILVALASRGTEQPASDKPQAVSMYYHQIGDVVEEHTFVENYFEELVSIVKGENLEVRYTCSVCGFSAIPGQVFVSPKATYDDEDSEALGNTPQDE